MTERSTFYDQMVFSGGGTRCFWQGGFLHVLREELPLWPQRITGVSGGALAACGFVCHRGRQVLETMEEAFANLDRNLPLHEPVDGKPGYTPHQQTYRAVVSDVLDAEASRQIAEGPRLQILIGRPPSSGWAKLSGSAVTLFYEADMIVRSSPHLKWAEAAGLGSELVDANKAARDGKLVDLVAAAATIPPAFEPPLWDGEPAVDAGMADQAPLPDPDEGRTLILLTRRYRDLPRVEHRTYVQPSQEVPADKIDFTDPSKLHDTWRIGEEDARHFLAELANDQP